MFPPYVVVAFILLLCFIRSSRLCRLAFKVTEEEVKLYYNCQLYNELMVKRNPEEIVFDPGSTLYLGQAGAFIKGHFEVRNFEFNSSLMSKADRVLVDVIFYDFFKRVRISVINVIN